MVHTMNNRFKSNLRSAPAFGYFVDQFLADLVQPNVRQSDEFKPAVDVCETAKEYIFTLSIPGFAKEDITLEVKDRVISIFGRHENKTEASEELKYHRREIRRESFSRSFNLPKDADLAQISAKYENGLLHIEVVKLVEQEPEKREISIS